MQKTKIGRWMLVLVLLISSVYVLADYDKADASQQITLPVSQNFQTDLVYRFYSPVFHGHFYTIDWNEAMHVANEDSNWNYEGTIGEAYYMQEPDSIPVYRFWSPVFEGHFYTTDYNEMVQVRDFDPNWEYEGIAYFAYPVGYQVVSDVVYRFWSPVFLHHFYTTDWDEATHLTNFDPNWEYEGEAYNLPYIVIV
ncbi:hypothetical protein KJ855_00670 [Patescibacteria group bacterium]|nr:hypothetical protein [Patescibacteria group bacterium]